MRLLIVTLIGFVTSSFALPQYGKAPIGGGANLNPSRKPSPNLPAGCQIQYKTIYDIVEKEQLTQKCSTQYKDQCTQKYNNVCTPYTENVCQTLYNNVCETKYRDNCYQAQRDVQEPYEEDVCVDKDVPVCDKHWQCNNPNTPLSNCNDKIWVDNQESCKYLKKTVCNKVQKYRTVKQPYRKCDKESWQDCNDVPYQQCNPVTKQRCEDVPYNDCQKVPYQACQPVHKLVKEQVSQKRPFRVCTGVNEPYKYTNQEIEDYDFIELRTGATDSDVGSPVDNGLTEDDPNRDVEQITTKKPPKSSDAIVFG